MPRYYFHLRSKETFVWDREGVELPDPAMACGAADRAVAELRGGLMHDSRHECYWIVAVTDEVDEVIHVASV
ncbi:DUF6894 family protein [Microvirga sesbaniae]|uniref:DUF6894 family protein n=1 Tax=Microvirga sesbaniae TaxID=681392 RepID=UPI0021C73E19|nr:hypothetical protein [Microvirga sp. HBU67692]